MSGVLGYVPRLAVLIDGLEMTPDAVNRLVALALMQAHITANELRSVVIPSLAPSKRSFATDLARRIERGQIFSDSFLCDLETFNSTLGIEIDAGTHVYWHGDENHTRGGYRSIFVEPGASALSEAKSELALLRDTVLAAVSAAKALEHADLLADKE